MSREVAPGGVESCVEDARTGELMENHEVELRLGETLRLFARPAAVTPAEAD